jgi:hypothetical protein
MSASAPSSVATAPRISGVSTIVSNSGASTDQSGGGASAATIRPPARSATLSSRRLTLSSRSDCAAVSRGLASYAPRHHRQETAECPTHVRLGEDPLMEALRHAVDLHDEVAVADELLELAHAQRPDRSIVGRTPGDRCAVSAISAILSGHVCRVPGFTNGRFFWIFGYFVFEFLDFSL